MNPQELITRHSRQLNDPTTNNEFLGFSLADVILSHRRYDAALAAIAKLHHKQRLHNKGEGLAICGPSGVGKSEILKAYSIHFPPNESGPKTVMPVLLVTCPSSATANGLVSAIFDAMGYPTPSRPDMAEKTIKLCKIIKMYGVELILIDEFQHAYYSQSMAIFRQLIDTVKNIINIAKISSVLVGLNEIEEVISSNEQVARRHAEKIEISNFQMNDEEDFREFRAILKAYQDALLIKPSTPLHEANLARRFLIGSNGNLDYLRRILEKSVEIPGFAGYSELNEQLYAAAFKEYVWKAAPEKLNPFSQESILRQLNKPGEPYYPWHLKHAIGSPLARRNLIKPSGALK